MKKLKINNHILVILTVVFPIIIFIFPLSEYLVLNKITIETVKNKTPSAQTIFYYKLFGENISRMFQCHLDWLNLLTELKHTSIDENYSHIKESMSCSYLTTKMIHKLAQENKSIAMAALEIYPKDTFVLYWLFNILEIEDDDYAIEIAQRIIISKPKDAMIWRRLGSLYWSRGEYNKGLDAYIQACTTNDKASNGCYAVGRSYHALRDYEKALYYYRLSYWGPAHERADRLEAELAGSK